MTAEPPITLRAAHDSGAGNLTPTRVVIHATCPSVGYPKATAPGAAHGTALYFQQQAAGGSAHYVCGVDGEEHCVPDAVVAWHAPPNPQSLGIEITAEGGQYALGYTRAQWLSPQVWPAVARAAARTRDLCDRFGIPAVKLSAADLLAGKRGICGHVDVSQAWKQSTHSDPGPNFPWPEFMHLVIQGADMPLTSDDLNAVALAVWGWKTSGQGTQAQDRLTGIDGVQLPAIKAALDAVNGEVGALAAAVAKLPTTSTGGGTSPAQPVGQVALSDADKNDIAHRVAKLLGSGITAAGNG